MGCLVVVVASEVDEEEEEEKEDVGTRVGTADRSGTLLLLLTAGAVGGLATSDATRGSPTAAEAAAAGGFISLGTRESRRLGTDGLAAATEDAEGRWLTAGGLAGVPLGAAGTKF